MVVDGSAFVEICHAAQITWDSNLIMDVIDGPLLLEVISVILIYLS